MEAALQLPWARSFPMDRLRAALAEIASMHRDGLLTDEEVRAHASILDGMR